MALNLCYLSIVYCRQEEFFFALNTRDTFRGQNVQKKFPYPQVHKIQMAQNFCYLSIVHCRQEEFFYAQNNRDTFRWQNVQKKLPYPQELNIQTATKWQQICVTFLLCIVDRRNFSVLKTLGTLLGSKMVRKSSPIHRCLKFQRRPNSPIFVLPFCCVMLNGGFFLCSKHQGHFLGGKMVRKRSPPLSTGAENSNGDQIAPYLCSLSVVLC